MTKKITIKEYISKDLVKARNREKIHSVIKRSLKGVDREQVRAFALRTALRCAWVLEGLEVKDSEKLDKFYYFWITNLSTSLALSLSRQASIETSLDSTKIIRQFRFGAAAAAAAYAADAYAAAAAAYANFQIFIDQINYDLSFINDSNYNKLSLYTEVLWNTENKQKIKLPNLTKFDDIWLDNIFKPAMAGKLISAATVKFAEAFMDIDEQTHKSQSASILAKYMDGKTDKIREARLIVLGNGGAGKTSLVKLLHGKFEQMDRFELSTPRVSVSTLLLNKINLSIWDFGGQVIMHSTHSFFISSKSTYLIVCNQRANEQPDEWLDVIANRIQNNQQPSHVIVVYSYCEHSNDKAWNRQHALKRKYKNIELVFKNIDMNPDITKDIFNKTEIEQTIEKFTSMEARKSKRVTEIIAIKEIADNYEKQGKPFIYYDDLKKELTKQGVNTDDLTALLKSANAYGYIFPEIEFDLIKDEEIKGKFILVNQRHWLTYGIYQLVNSGHIQQANGILTDASIKAALNNGQPRYISADGSLNDKKPAKQESEQVIYKAAGIEVLKKIIINYRWGFKYDPRHDEILFPLSTNIDEPENLPTLFNIKSTKNYSYMELVFNNKPKDFFFRLVTYFGAHITNAKHLWRTGVVLHFYGQVSDQALLEIEGNVLKISVIGTERNSFMQQLFINIKQTLKAYENLQATVYERILIGKDKYEMVSSDMIDKLIKDQGLIEKMRSEYTHRGSEMTKITINNHGDNTIIQAGPDSQATMNVTINEKAEDLMALFKQQVGTVDGDDKTQLNTIVAGLQNVIKEEDDKKKEGRFQTIVQGAKDFVSLDKAVNILGENYNRIYEMLSNISVF